MADMTGKISSNSLARWRRWPEWIGFAALLLAIVYFAGEWLIQGLFVDAGMFRWLPAQGWIRGHSWLLMRLADRWADYGFIYLPASWFAFSVCYVRITRHILNKSRCNLFLWLSAAAALIALLLLPFIVWRAGA